MLGQLSDGVRVSVTGTVRSAGGEMLRSKPSGRPCVFWEHRTGLGEPARERGARDFWIEDGTGRALVRTERMVVDVRAERRNEAVALIDADIEAVSQRIRELKKIEKASGVTGTIRNERRQLAYVATVLCAVRAHARGKVHLGGTLAGQHAWITQNAPRVGSTGEKAISMVLGHWETIIQEGQRIHVDGVARLVPMPAEIGFVGGYRDTSTCYVIEAPEGGSVRVQGLGVHAPVERHGAGPDPLSSGAGSVPRWVARAGWVAVTAAGIAYALWMLWR